MRNPGVWERWRPGACHQYQLQVTCRPQIRLNRMVTSARLSVLHYNSRGLQTSASPPQARASRQMPGLEMRGFKCWMQGSLGLSLDSGSFTGLLCYSLCTGTVTHTSQGLVKIKCCHKSAARPHSLAFCQCSGKDSCHCHCNTVLGIRVLENCAFVYSRIPGHSLCSHLPPVLLRVSALSGFHWPSFHSPGLRLGLELTTVVGV